MRTGGGLRAEPPVADPLDALFVGEWSGWRGTLAWNGSAGAIAATALADADIFAALIDRFQATKGGPDRVAATSFWTQCYFSALIIPAVVAILGLERSLPLGLPSLRIAFCPKTGLPRRFGMTAASGADETRPFAPLIEDHLTPLIAILRRHSGLSSRLLWENAGWHLVWALGEAGRRFPASVPHARDLLADPSWPAGRCHAIDGMRQAALDGLPAIRRVCCLRYRVPGFPYCERICPLTDCAARAAPKAAR